MKKRTASQARSVDEWMRLTGPDEVISNQNGDESMLVLRVTDTRTVDGLDGPIWVRRILVLRGGGREDVYAYDTNGRLAALWWPGKPRPEWVNALVES
jgi:hypothetical protein